MCENCGCGSTADAPITVSARHDAQEQAHEHEHEHSHGHSHSHEASPGTPALAGSTHDHDHSDGHSHDASHFHSHPHEQGNLSSDPAEAAEARRTVDVGRAILEKNDRLAERNRGFFRARGLLVLNVLSAPGSGKTALLRETVRTLAPDLKAGVVVGDLATDNDAQRLRETGAPVVQITTGTVCHLEARMVARAVAQLNLDGLGLLIIENVGNLVCPASYDLGEDLRVVLLSVTEGEDKPLKYPPMFQAADVVVISKIDLAEACGYDRDLALANIRRVAPRARLFETSARTGQGMGPWRDFLLRQSAERKASGPLGPDL
ncbi:MAG: hydrogenase nickel incorporation protein HypB [Limisphaerales bacterium]